MMNVNSILIYLPEICIAILGMGALLQILYYLALFSRFSFHKQKNIEISHKNVPVSIVIVAKNDAHILINTLPELLNQDYPQFEVVVVNDNSKDETAQLVVDFQNRFSNLKLLNLESSVTNIRGKKFPLSLGIKAANYDYVLLTDADCLPASNQWIRLMAQHFSDTTQIVLGYNRIRKKIGFINSLIRFDRLHQAIQYFSYCLARMPFMGMGQNLAYTKTIFFKNKGFAYQNHLQFGDDDLFINRVATAQNCAMEYAKEAHTISRFGANFGHWLSLKVFRRKTRKLNTKPKRFLLNFYHFLITFFYIALGFAVYFTINNIIYLSVVLGIIMIKFIVQYICFGIAAKKLDEKSLIPNILLYDIFFAFFNPIIYIFSIFKK